MSDLVFEEHRALWKVTPGSDVIQCGQTWSDGKPCGTRVSVPMDVLCRRAVSQDE